MLSTCTAVELRVGLGGAISCSSVVKAALSNRDVKYFQCCMPTLFPSPVVKSVNGHEWTGSQYFGNLQTFVLFLYFAAIVTRILKRKMKPYALAVSCINSYTPETPRNVIQELSFYISSRG